MTATIRFDRRMILASAGSGKTFALSGELIGLLAAQCPPQQIFASTFTRKAAGEILNRVLLRLARAALSDTDAAELAQHSPYAKLDRAGYRDLLADLTRHLHHLNISTLDSFFVRAAGCFALELMLPPGWRIIEDLDDRLMRSDAVNAVLESADPQTIVELLRMLNRGESRRSVHQRLLDIADQLHNLYRQSLQSDADPWNCIDEPPAQSQLADDQLFAIVESLGRIDVPRTKTGSPSKNWLNAIRNAQAAAMARDWAELFDISLVQRIVENAPQFDKRDITPDVRAVFDPLIQHAQYELFRELVRQGRAIKQLLALYDQQFTAMQRQRRGYRFDHITAALSQADLSGRAADIYFRLDAQVRHLLLDEFQDTSVPQWLALKPIAAEPLSDASGDRASLIVADPKQSIYGWRGAAPTLVRRIAEDPAYGLRIDHLSTSWRSSPVILDAVNRVFTTIAANKTLSEYADAVAQWSRDFEPHISAKPNLPGHVKLITAPVAAPLQKQNQATLIYAAGFVRDLHQSAPRNDIAVLVRRNAVVARLIYELRRMNIDASEEGGNPLTDSPAVVSVMALLTLADHPGDTIARYHVAHTPVGPAVGFTDHANDRAAQTLAVSLRRQLLIDGYGQTLRWMVDRLAGHCDQRDLTRLEQLIELGCRYDERDAGLRPADFVAMVRSHRVESPSASPVRVMTYHQAKGLEFDAVVLPELDTSILAGVGRDALVMHQRDADGKITAIFPYLNEQLRRLFPATQPLYDQMTRVVVRDALSQLYVAMTRARNALYMIVSPGSQRGNSEAVSMSNILHAALEDDFEIGDANWHGSTAPAPGMAPAPAPTAQTESPAVSPRLAKADPARRRLLPRTSPSKLEGRKRVMLADELRLEHSGTEYGSRMHELAQKIEWSDPPEVSDTDIEAMREIVKTDAIREALSKARWHEPGVRVMREEPFVVRDGGVVLNGIFDRVVVLPGRVVVQDYKTDGDLVERITERYRPQMQAYRRAAGQLFGVGIDHVDVELILLHHGVVVNV